MPIIAVVNQKGGCGKSTTAVHLAYWLQEMKQQRVVLVDADSQGSSAAWLKGLTTVIPYKTWTSADELMEGLPEIKSEYDYVVVDAPAGLAELTRAILFWADLVLIPCQPTGVDLRSSAYMLRLLAQAQQVRGGAPDARLFVNRATKGTKLLDESIELLSNSPVKLCRTVVFQRQMMADCFGQGKVAWQMKGSKIAAQEIERLFKELWNDTQKIG